MSGEPKMFRIVNPDNRASEAVTEVEFAQLGFQERRDIQEWIAENPSILSDDLLIVGKEFSGFDLTNERLDLLAVDTDGKLVIIELKRDDSGADAHWQAIKYASYFRHTPADRIVGMLSDYARISEDEAANRLLQHLQADDLNGLNVDQRIILASHRFAPEVTSAVLWLNEKAPGENLITCVQLIPYQDHDRLYVQASTIIPLPGIDDYLVKVGSSVQADGEGGGSLREKLRRTSQQHKNDNVTTFLQRAADVVIHELSERIKPDMRSQWAGGGPRARLYRLWYSSPPWSRRDMCYRINLYPQNERGEWQAVVEFRHNQDGLTKSLTDISISDEQSIEDNAIRVSIGSDTLNEDFSRRISATTRKFIEEITPIVNEFVDSDNETEVQPDG